MDKIRTAVTFERVVMAAIVANAAVMMLSWTIEGHEELFERSHLAFLGFFSIEIGIRLRRLGWNPRRFLSDGWLVFDTVVVSIALVPAAGSVMLLQVVRSARLVHGVRHLGHLASHLRLARLFAK